MSDQTKKHVQATVAGDEPASDMNSDIQSNGLEERLAELADKYFLCMKKSAEQAIAKAKIIAQAEEEVGKKYLVKFYARIGLDPKGSTLKKLRKIGEEAQRFEPFLHILPDDWTTIYNLAVAPKDKFLHLADNGVLTPTSTWAQLRVHCIEAKPKQPKKVRPRITLDLNDVPLGKRSRFVRQMTDICNEFSVSLPEAQRATLNDFVPVIDKE